MKKYIIGIILLGLALFFFGTGNGRMAKQVVKSYFVKPVYINKQGNTISQRCLLPEGFVRTSYPEGSFQNYLQQYPLKPFGAKVINYDGEDYIYQAGHIGVLDLPVPNNGLQQCADALIRIRSEYLWQQNRKEEIGFNFTSGHYCSWQKYASGHRPIINGNRVSFNKTAAEDYSHENFYRYLNLIFMYSGTQSLFDELPQLNAIEDIEVGDMLIYPGSPGHVIMVVDKAEHANGRKLFIFAQGNTPAQSVHVLKNPNNSDLSPWY
ncbi:MAG: hypothetical protein DWP94_04530, partial [Flavobacterium sp.]